MKELKRARDGRGGTVLAMLERSACSGERQSLKRLPAPLRDRVDEMYNGTASLVLELRAILSALEAKGVRDAAAAEAIVGKVVQHLLSGVPWGSWGPIR